VIHRTSPINKTEEEQDAPTKRTIDERRAEEKAIRTDKYKAILDASIKKYQAESNHYSYQYDNKG